MVVDSCLLFSHPKCYVKLNKGFIYGNNIGICSSKRSDKYNSSVRCFFAAIAIWFQQHFMNLFMLLM